MEETTKTDPGGSSTSEDDAYEELQCYTLAHGDQGFIHQHVVDAWAAQHANEQTKPISLAFALIGLYLHVEKGFSGREVQRAHMRLAQNKRDWPSFALPPERGSITSSVVMAASAGPERDRAIDAWCESIWKAFDKSREAVMELLRQHKII
jgi:Family of unknown function (DUF5946)